MEAVWNYNPELAHITVRDLLRMASGLGDYDDRVIHTLTLSRPDWDIGPLDYLALQREKRGGLDISCACSAGSCPGPPSLHSIPAHATPPSPNCCNATNHRKCSAYDSLNYLLLGMLVVAQTADAEQWEDVDQKASELLRTGCTVCASTPPRNGREREAWGGGGVPCRLAI
jgi:CubicO group peptidase (beta-lactamase class C family)